MKAYAITILNNKRSENGTKALMRSAPDNVEMHAFDAITPDSLWAYAKDNELYWTYPKFTSTMREGMALFPYETGMNTKRFSCFASHHALWRLCIEQGEPIIVHEHDAVYLPIGNPFILPLDYLEESKYSIIGLNSPFGATRLAGKYNEEVLKSKTSILEAPTLHPESKRPEGIAGNSSYYLKPDGAELLLRLTKQHGAWPNDALMCRQLCEGKLGQTKRYYTTIQMLKSTTTC